MKKKKWSAPLLTILVRDKPEERVLGSCKEDGLVGPTAAELECSSAVCDWCVEASLS